MINQTFYSVNICSIQSLEHAESYIHFFKFIRTYSLYTLFHFALDDPVIPNKKVSSPHYLKNSLKRNPRSISEITFYANLNVRAGLPKETDKNES